MSYVELKVTLRGEVPQAEVPQAIVRLGQSTGKSTYQLEIHPNSSPISASH
jgi:hypothetical protein